MERLTLELIKEKIAPCGLHCGKCFAHKKGDIKKYSQKLKRALGNFDVYAQRFVGLLNEPTFEKYPDFKGMLEYFSSTVGCEGCRNEKCKLFKDCGVKDCHAEKQVDFCYQCGEFPCSRTGFDEHLYRRFVNINQKIKLIGIEKYYREIKGKSRY